VPDVVKGVKAVIGELKISDEICWNLTDLELYSWTKVGKRGPGAARRDRAPRRARAPARTRAAGPIPEGDGRRGWTRRPDRCWRGNIWLARDSTGLDESIDKAVASRWATQRKAAAKQPASADVSKDEEARRRRRSGETEEARERGEVLMATTKGSTTQPAVIELPELNIQRLSITGRW
jgi:hypothetical protein